MMARTSNTSKPTKKEEVSNDLNSDLKIPPKRTTTSSFMQTMRNNLSKRQNAEENSMNSSNSSKKQRLESKSNKHSIDPTVLLQFKQSSQNTNIFDDSRQQVEKLGSHLPHQNIMSKYVRESTLPSVRSRTYNNIINNNISTSADRTKRYAINRPNSTYSISANKSSSRQRTEFVPHITSFKNTRKIYHGYRNPSINTSPNKYDPNINSQHGYDPSISAQTGYRKPSIHALPGYDSSNLARTSYRKPSIYAQPGYQSSISARTGYRKPSIHEPAGYQNPFVSDVARSSRSLSELKGYGTPRNSHHFTTKAGSSGVANLSPQEYENYRKHFQGIGTPNELKNNSRVHKYTSSKYRNKSPSLHGIKYGNSENPLKAYISKKYCVIYQWNARLRIYL